MLPRRDKILVEPWLERRYKDHRAKVQSALPNIDDRPPKEHPHVTLKLKKCQREMDRKMQIQRENFILLQRLQAIMRVNRLDNYWARPLPNLQRKVGAFYDKQNLNDRLKKHLGCNENLNKENMEYLRCSACARSKRPHRSNTAILPRIEK